MEAITVLKDRLPTREVGIIYRAVEKIDTADKRYLNAIKDRLEKGTWFIKRSNYLVDYMKTGLFENDVFMKFSLHIFSPVFIYSG